MIIRLIEVMITIAWAGKDFTSLNFPAPKYCEIMEEIALRVCPNTQMSMDKNVVTMPTAAKDSVGLFCTFPTIAVSVRDRIGSEIPAIRAGIANLLIFFRLRSVLTILVRSSKKDTHFG